MTKERLQILLKNAIVWIDEENSDFFAAEVDNEYEWYKTALGITKDELLELGGRYYELYTGLKELDQEAKASARIAGGHFPPENKEA